MIRRGTEHLPRVVYDWDELPEPVRRAYESLPPLDLRQNIIIPPQDHYFSTRSWREKLTFTRSQTPQRTLFFGTNRLVIIEETDPIQTLIMPLAELLALELTTVLLYSALDVAWQQAGRIRTVQIEFNSVGARLIGEELTHARSYLKTRQSGLPLTDQPAEVAIKALPLKFKNYTRLSLLPEERVWTVSHEPAIRQEGARFQPYLSPNRVFLLADYHLIMLADSRPNWRGTSQAPYQIEQHYYPRQHIQALRLEEAGDLTWLTLSLGTAQLHHDIRWPLTPANAAAFQAATAAWLPQRESVF